MSEVSKTTLIQILSATRPKTLMASVGPVTLGISLAVSHNHKLNILIALITLICAIFLQISSNLINDYFDAIKGIDGVDRIGPKRLAHTSKTWATKIKIASISTMLISFFLGCLLMYYAGTPIIIIGLCSLLFAFLYTGGPAPLSYYGLGEVLAFIFFGPIAVWGTYFLQTKSFMHADQVILYGYLPGLISACIMSINNLRDLKSDSKTRKKTVAIFLGEKKARVFTLILATTPLVLIFILILIGQQKWFTILAGLVFFIFSKTWISILKEPIGPNFNNHLASTGKYLFLFCTTYSILILL